MDCRGLEFVDFKADVRFFPVPRSTSPWLNACSVLTGIIRANGRLKEQTPLHHLRRLTSQRVNGMIMTRRPGMRFRSRRLGGWLRRSKDCMVVRFIKLFGIINIELRRIESCLNILISAYFSWYVFLVLRVTLTRRAWICECKPDLTLCRPFCFYLYLLSKAVHISPGLLHTYKSFQ